MLCLEFPPVNTTGNYRSAGIARYLCNQGIDVSVLTGTEFTLKETFNKGVDYDLLQGLEKVKIYRFPIKPFKKIWKNGIGDKLRIWWNTTDKIDRRWYFDDNKKKINEIITKEKPDYLYVSLPPFSMARTAIEISKKFNIPLITDMRDAWSLWVTSPFATRFHYKKIYRLEKDLFKASKYILGVTHELINDFKTQHQEIDPEKFKVIYNGYDTLKEGDQKYKIRHEKQIYKIGYVGSFYYNPDANKVMSFKWYKRNGLKKLYYTPRKEDWKYRSPYFFLKTLSTLLINNPELKSKVTFEFVGNEPFWLKQMVEDFKLENNYKALGFLGKQEVMNVMNSWDGVLATSEKVMNGKHFCLPSKLFDVVESKKRILAFVTPGSQFDFLRNYSQTIIFDPDKTPDNVKLLKKIINETGNFITDSISHEFSREYQSNKLLALLE